MLIIEIDTIDPQPFQAFLTGRSDILRSAVYSSKSSVAVVTYNPKLCRDNRIPTVNLERFAEQTLIRVRSVDVCGIEECDPEIECAMDGSDGLGVVPTTIEFGHSHASQSERRDVRATASKLTLLHSLEGQPSYSGSSFDPTDDARPE